MRIPHEKHVLANGLEVVLHRDPTDPLVAVHVTYHVGSARERPGLSGFAHLFEHMLFQGSERVPEGEFFRRIQAVGGALNGSTSQDRTTYWEVVPKDALELALFLESDRMGWLLPAMTQAKLDNQRDVVKNERRQNYDNRPYGRVHETVLAALYPPEHPYAWPTIGSMEDISAAALEDVAAFFRRWYGPNNATLAIGGDLEPARALALVEAHFGALPPGPPVDRPAPLPAALREPRRLVLEDRVRQPQLSLVWPTVHAWHPDEPALNLLADALSANKASLFDRVLVLEERLASHVTVWPHAGELAGFLRLDLRPSQGRTLGELERRVDELLERFVREGVPAERLARLIARREGALLRSLETVTARTAVLALTNCTHGEPDRLQADLERHRAVTPDDLVRAARRWILERPRLSLSTVPEGRAELASDAPAAARARAPRARAAEPAQGAAGEPFAGRPWRRSLANGAALGGLGFAGVPLARLSIALDAGRLREDAARRGAATLCAELLEEGTSERTSAAWTDALDGLGAVFGARATSDELVLTVAALDERFEETLALLGECLAAPRFDPEDVERARGLRLLALETQADRARELADEVFRAAVHGRASALGAPRLGERAAIETLTRADLVAFWRAGQGAADARVCYVGPRPAADVAALLAPWSAWWRLAPRAPAAADGLLAPREGVRVRLVPKPGAPQAELRVGHASVARTHPDFEPLRALNHVLGGGFTSRLNLNLREDKGYTYGVRSSFAAGRTHGRFCVATAVDTPNAVRALEEILSELAGMRRGVRADEVLFARRSLSQALALAYDATASKLALLETMLKYDLPDDHLARRHAWLAGMEASELDRLAREHLRPDALEVVVVGDAERLAGGLERLGALEVLAPDGSPAA